MTTFLSTGSVERIWARVEASIAAGQYSAGLQLIEMCFTHRDPPGMLLGPYVLCLAACGQPEKANDVAARAVTMLAGLPKSDYRDGLLMLIAASVRMGAQFAVEPGATAKSAPEALWGGG